MNVSLRWSRLAFLVLGGLVVAGLTSRAAAAGPNTGPVRGPHVTVELVAEEQSVRPGTTSTIGVHFRLDPKWHSYWTNSGDAGLTPTFVWTLPPGVTVAPLPWPAPHRMIHGPVATYAYEKDVLYPFELTVGQDAAPPSVALRVAVDWLVCDEECVPGDATLALELVVKDAEPLKDPARKALFAAMRKAQPQPLPAGATARLLGESILLELEGAATLAPPGTTAYFFPSAPRLLTHIASQPLKVLKETNRVSLALPVAQATARDPIPPRLGGLVVFEKGSTRRPYAIDVALEGAPPPMGLRPRHPTSPSTAAPPLSPAAGGDPAATTASGGGTIAPTPLRASRWPLPGHGVLEFEEWGGGEEAMNLWLALLFALLGGIVLNVMPCVLPVLSIKILGFVEHAGDDPAKVRRHGYAFGVGVLVSFWALIAILLVLRAAGEAVGWGFQLQSPVVVAAMALLLFVMGLNLAGTFEIGGKVSALAAGAADGAARNTYLASFVSGILATLIATPCAAPFMAGAVGYAMTAPAVEAVSVFTALGLGMALPYVILSIFPHWLHRLPRPGPWMETFKKAMSFPMFGVAAYFLWVFGRQTGVEGMRLMLIAFLGAALAAWIYGHWAALHRSGKVRWIVGHVGAAAVLAVALSYAWRGTQVTPAEAGTPAVAEGWAPYENYALAAHLDAGRPVLLDFTADWCVSCKANEKLVLDTDTVNDAVRAHGVALLQADWTRKDKAITDALASFGRGSVPVYVVFSPHPGRKPLLLPPVITPRMVREAIERASTP